jgi:hypothetical protein
MPAVAQPLPPAANRLAPCQVLSARKLAMRASPPEKVMKEDLGVLYAPAEPDAEIEFDLETAEPGRCHVAAVLIETVFSSRYQPMLDGRPVGRELDLCSQGEDWNRRSLDLRDLAAGKHSLELAGRGASPARCTKALPAFAFGMDALTQPVNAHTPYQGRDGAARWFAYDNPDPRGVVSCATIFGHRNTDNASAHFVSFVHNLRERRAVLRTGWDDGILIQLGDPPQSDCPAHAEREYSRDEFRAQILRLPRGVANPLHSVAGGVASADTRR